MRRTGWTAGAVLGALLMTGCGPDGPAAGASASHPAWASASVSAEPAGPFGKEGAAADVAAATAAAGLNQPAAEATPTPTPGDPDPEKAKRRAELLACAAPWQTMDRVADPVKAYEATITTLEQRGWKRGDRRQVDMLTQTTLTKQGWTVLASRYDFSAGKGSGTGMPDILSFMATEQACEGRFTDAELEEAFKS